MFYLNTLTPEEKMQLLESLSDSHNYVEGIFGSPSNEFEFSSFEARGSWHTFQLTDADYEGEFVD